MSETESSPKITATLKAISSMRDVEYSKKELKTAEDNIETIRKWTLRSVMEASLANALFESFKLGADVTSYCTKEVCFEYVRKRNFTVKEIQCILDTAPKASKQEKEQLEALQKQWAEEEAAKAKSSEQPQEEQTENLDSSV
jgi:hypothetical protein